MKKLIKVALLMALFFSFSLPVTHSVRQAIDIPIGPMDSPSQTM